MELTGPEQMEEERKAFLTRLNVIVGDINQADSLVAQNNPTAVANATALLLSTIAKVMVLEAASAHRLNERLIPFARR